MLHRSPVPANTRVRVPARLLCVLVVVAGMGSGAACTEVAALPSPEPGAAVYGVFEGRVPCQDCERIKVRLTLFEDPASSDPAACTLERIHVGKGDDRTVDSGGWRTTIGAPTDSDATVVVLDPGPPEFARYQHVGPDILLILDGASQPRVGDASGSFTLSRTG